MLLQFNVENFKSFKNEASLDMTAINKMNEYNENLRNIGKEKVLPVTAIFGANASGKSNIIDAFKFMTNYVLRSILFDESIELKNNDIVKAPNLPTFAFDNETKNGSSTFEVYFVDESKTRTVTYNYGFVLKNGIVVEEWLNSKAKTSKIYKNIFYRNTEDKKIELNDFSKKQEENIKDALGDKTLIVSLGSILKIEKLKKIRDWFYDNEIINFGDPIGNAFISMSLPDNFVDDENVREDVVNYISTFDESILGFRVEKIDDDSKKDDDFGSVRVYTIHSMKDSDEKVELSLSDESDGTLKMFSLYNFLKDVLDKGSVLMIDELNGKLHPNLTRNIIRTFMRKETNPNNSQLIFTSHDSNNMKILRRDEIWFAEKDEYGQSILYSLADIRVNNNLIRSDENYEKNYLVGKYGGIPIIKNLAIQKEV